VCLCVYMECIKAFISKCNSVCLVTGCLHLCSRNRGIDLACYDLTGFCVMFHAGNSDHILQHVITVGAVEIKMLNSQVFQSGCLLCRRINSLMEH